MTCPKSIGGQRFVLVLPPEASIERAAGHILCVPADRRVLPYRREYRVVLLVSDRREHIGFQTVFFRYRWSRNCVFPIPVEPKRTVIVPGNSPPPSFSSKPGMPVECRCEESVIVEAVNHRPDGEGFDSVIVSPCNNNGLEQSVKSGGVKSGVICENPENEHLSDVISAWSFLPSHFQEAILLLVRQYVQ